MNAKSQAGNLRPNAETGERGATLLEFVIAASMFLMMLVAIVAGAHLFWTHNALVESTRRGARYAVLHATTTNDASVRSVVVYGTPTPSAGASPFVPRLSAENVTVTPSGLGVGQGRVRVEITGYQYHFAVPFLDFTIDMPAYGTTMAGECAGLAPPEL
jgi:hypothetical protein